MEGLLFMLSGLVVLVVVIAVMVSGHDEGAQARSINVPNAPKK